MQESHTAEFPKRKSRLRLRHLFGGVLLLTAGLVFWGVVLARPSVQNPLWKGRPLSYWLRQNDYAVHADALSALGTNAMPYLLRELQARNPFYARWGGACLPEFTDWDFARSRRYHSALALQLLDTNAAPILLDIALASPMCVAQGELGMECAMVLQRLETPASRRLKDARLNQALRAPEASLRRNACRVFYFGTKPTPDQLEQMVELLGDPDDSVRAAAVRALGVWGQTNSAIEPLLAAALQDRHPGVRRLAAVAIIGRSNAVSLLPALREAYVREPSMPRPTNDVDFLFRGPDVLSPKEQRVGFFQVIRYLDPAARYPH
jgi:hypothetical protein